MANVNRGKVWMRATSFIVVMWAIVAVAIVLGWRMEVQVGLVVITFFWTFAAGAKFLESIFGMYYDQRIFCMLAVAPVPTLLGLVAVVIGKHLL